MKRFNATTLFILVIFSSSVVIAGEVDVENVEISAAGGGNFRVDVTLRHADSGWDHYANQWDVLSEDGKVIGSRVLYHPHVNEQPFTRSLTLEIPKSVKRITIAAHDLVHKTGGKTLDAEVPH